MSVTAVVCRPVTADALDGQMETELARLLCEMGMEALIISELYHVSEDSEAWGQLAALTGPIALFCRLHPRPMQWLLHRHGIGRDGMHMIDLRQHDAADTAVDALEALLAAGRQVQRAEHGMGSVMEIAEPATARWYPVLDASRCTNCQHCLQFCIFGVYGTDENGRVRVAAPDNCKPGCPACARICPNSAIMFPLCDEDEAIAGAPGKLVTLDAAGKRMYYARTGATCPQCGQSGTEAGGREGAEKCRECGRAVDSDGATLSEEGSDVLAEIDALVQKLEDMSSGGQ